MGTYTTNSLFYLPDYAESGEDNLALFNAALEALDGTIQGILDVAPADNADTVDNIHAATTATANKLLALDASAKLPADITGDAATVDSKDASDFQQDVFEESVWYPEFAGMTTTKNASATTTGTWSTEWDSTENTNYYKWTSDEAALQDYSFNLMRKLPTLFTSWGTNALVIRYKTTDATAANNCVDVRIYKNGVIVSACTTQNNKSATWADITITGTNMGSWAAGDILGILVTLKAKSTNEAYLGKITVSANH